MQKSSIEWTDVTWNTIRGCTEVSTGCAKCYARRIAERFRGIAGHPYEYGFDVRLAPNKLEEPFHTSKNYKVFTNSMSDFFHEDVPQKFQEDIVHVMQTANWHTYQVLTKRPERMKYLLKYSMKDAGDLENVWWGVSVENKAQGVPRIDILRDTRAKVRFLSIEPLLEDLGKLNLDMIDWVIVGGESGDQGPRPIEESWILNIRDQCRELGIPFFFKQWGGVDKKSAGRALDRREYDGFPEYTPNQIPGITERRRLWLEHRERVAHWIERSDRWKNKTVDPSELESGVVAS